MDMAAATGYETAEKSPPAITTTLQRFAPRLAACNAVSITASKNGASPSEAVETDEKAEAVAITSALPKTPASITDGRILLCLSL